MKACGFRWERWDVTLALRRTEYSSTKTGLFLPV